MTSLVSKRDGATSPLPACFVYVIFLCVCFTYLLLLLLLDLFFSVITCCGFKSVVQKEVCLIVSGFCCRSFCLSFQIEGFGNRVWHPHHHKPLNSYINISFTSIQSQPTTPSNQCLKRAEILIPLFFIFYH